MSTGAFDLLDKPLVYIPVKWKGIVAGEDGSAVTIDHEASIQVELLDRDEFAEWIVDANKDVVRATLDDGTPDPSDKRTDAEIRAERAVHELATFKRVAKGWRRMKVGTRNAEFSDENIARLLKWPGFVTALGATYMEAWRGELETREGNSDGSPANGRADEPTAATATAGTPAKSAS